MKLSFLPPAEAEFLGAIAYYNGQRRGLGEQLRRAVDDALQGIMQYPFGCAPEIDRPEIRLKAVKRFPYGVVYEVIEGGIVVHALMHLHRRPGYWDDR